MLDREKSKEQLIAELVRMRAEVAELTQAETKFLGLLESAPDAIVIIGRDGKIALVNNKTEELFGYQREELLGQPLEILVPKRYHQRHVKHRQHYADAPHTRPMGAGLELYAARKDGTEFPVEISLSPLETAEGVLITSIIRDVTDRKQTEEALRKAKDELEKRVAERTSELSTANQFLKEQIKEREQAEEKIREQAALLDVTLDAILVRDLDENIIYWNKGAEKLYGWAAEEAIGHRADQLLNKTMPPQVIEAHKQVLATGAWSGELVQVTKSGKEITIESRWTLVRDAEGNPKAKLIVNSDITEKKRLAAQFLRAQRMESIGTLAGGIAHDLNNALTPVLMAAQLLREQLTDEESIFLLNMIFTGAEHGSDMVKQVLSFARGMEGERIILWPRSLIGEIRKILLQTLPKSIQIETSLPTDLWAVDGDATQLYQVLMNICINARDAMPNGGKLKIKAENITIDENFARMRIEAQPGNYLLISVSDTGVGIPPDIKDKIFEPFFTTKEIGKGTGFGLSTALGIVRSHNGFIDVYSEVSKGTNFKIYLPAIEKGQIKALDDVRVQLPAGHGELVLIVEDEMSIREITSKTLETYNYKVVVASDGTEALALFVKNLDEIKVVLIDMMMPHLDGPGTIPVLQRLNANIKIIATSGLTSNNQIAEALGIKTFLSKPYTAERLLNTIAKVINE